MSAKTYLEEMYTAERNLRAAETRLLELDDSTVVKALQAAVQEARAVEDPAESGLRLERLSDLCAQVEGPEMVDSLLAILDAEDPAVRVAAGEALLDVGYERYAEFARAVERFLQGDGGPALTELPWILAEIGEPSALKLIRLFLKQESTEVIAASIEALAQLGDPEAIADLQQFVDDPRKVMMEDYEAETSTTLGELAQASIEELGGPLST
ncbi:MAG: HEAT repeat domain-containing protein [Myxococcota bacterium]